MAKVTGPLYSMSASGTIGKAMVHFGWKGTAVVRKWLKPVNRQTEGQGDNRLVFGGLGRATRAVEALSPYQVDAVIVQQPGMTWVSSFVQYIIANYMVDATAFEAEVTALGAHARAAQFASAAATLGLTEFDLEYKGTTSAFSAALQLYELAKYGVQKRGVGVAFDRAPYTTALADWTANNVTVDLAGDVVAP